MTDSRFLQGTRIRSLSPGHNGPVSGLVYVREDKVMDAAAEQQCRTAASLSNFSIIPSVQYTAIAADFFVAYFSCSL